MKKLVTLISSLLAIVVAVVVVRTVMHTPIELEPVETITMDLDTDLLSYHMSQAIQFKTVSNQPPTPLDPDAFEGFIAWLQATYPEAHAIMTREIIGDYTILLKWQGSDMAAKPILLTGHYDVVPVIPGT